MDNVYYNSYNLQYDIDPIKLTHLGFRAEEVQLLSDAVASGIKITTQSLTGLGMAYEEVKRIKYMSDICLGKVSIDNIDDMSKHLRRLYGNIRRLGIQDLALSSVSSVPRKVLVSGISDTTYKVYNSENYYNRPYDVVDVSGGRIFIETAIKPILKYRQPKKLDGVLEIKTVKDNGNIIVAINKEFCTLLNRFIVVGSLRIPEFHHGMIEMLAIDGTKVYVYAKSIGTRDSAKYNMGTERVYGYGFNKSEIRSKLLQSATMIYNQIHAVYSIEIAANQDFTVYIKDKSSEDSDVDDLIEL